eukprot:TRINITY_DN263_c0_g1_i2.p1 TRINITY_DN263_c0_g1~~TRINITY_DN263_c0_g1_i2.p1  ORF type:complete len:137 (-),score=37.61 TRINITY_DN263_c0_g1_i2:727-1137(-)
MGKKRYDPAKKHAKRKPKGQAPPPTLKDLNKNIDKNSKKKKAVPTKKTPPKTTNYSSDDELVFDHTTIPTKNKNDLMSQKKVKGPSSEVQRPNVKGKKEEKTDTSRAELIEDKKDLIANHASNFLAAPKDNYSMLR